MKLKEFINKADQTQEYKNDTTTATQDKDNPLQLQALNTQYEAQKILNKLPQSQNP